MDTLAQLSNNFLVCTLKILFSSVVPKLISKFIEFLPRGFGDKIGSNRYVV